MLFVCLHLLCLFAVFAMFVDRFLHFQVIIPEVIMDPVLQISTE